MEHQGTKTIETERLILRKFTADDLSAIFHNWTSDEKVTEFLRWPTHKSIDITKRVLESWLLEYEKPDFYQWAIIPKEIGEPIGTISVIELNEKTEKVHIGYCLSSRWWHCGFTSEAFTAVIAFLFEEVKVNRIETWHDPQNPNSGKVMLQKRRKSLDGWQNAELKRCVKIPGDGSLQIRMDTDHKAR